MAAGLAGVALAAAGCSGAQPSGFSKGDRWSFPLVGALENGPLITPVTVNGKGPYLFLIDPDANFSVIDQQVVDEAKLQLVPGPSRRDETGAEQARNYVELTDLAIGSLTVDKRQVMLVPSNFYNINARRVNGVIGRDVLADGLVFGFDRDQGVATLAAAKVFQPPPDAIALAYKPIQVSQEAAVNEAGTGASSTSTNNDDASRIGVATRGAGPRLDLNPPPRRIASAQIGGARFAMHLDLGATTSQLRDALWAKAKLTPTTAETKVRVVDELATVREIASVAVAESVAVGSASAGHVTLVPYVDKRFRLDDVDGALGLDFFRGYAVYASPAATTFYLKARGDAAATATARLGRWGAALPACPHPGCAAATLTQTDGGLKLDVVRDPESGKRPLELYLGVVPGAGKKAPNLIAELPAGADKISGGVPAEYDGATITVLDVSPFLRPCSGDGGCVFGAPGSEP